MNFSTPERVLATIRAGDSSAFEQGKNRCNILNAANCVPPFTAEVAKKMGLKVNVNFGDLMIALGQARRQYRTAVFSNQHFFKATLPYAPAQYQSDWGYFITDLINTKLRDNKKYFTLLDSVFTSVVTQGPGARLWYDKSWCPDFVSNSDLRIATDTYCDHENMGWFGVKHVYTPGELLRKAFKNGSKWEKPLVANILKNKKELNFEDPTQHYDWDSQPEKFAELAKQDGGWYSGDAMPGFPMWHFYFKDESIEGKEGWYMKIVPAEGTVGAGSGKFLWTSEEPIEKNLESILHIQYGDVSNSAPAKHHEVRSLGFILLEPTFYTNLSRCKGLQHLLEQFDVWLRSADPADKARAQMQEFGNYKILKPGLSIVPEQERHQVDSNFLEAMMANLKQLQQEGSSTYTQSTDTGTTREQTAFETSVKMEQVNAMLGGLLIKFFDAERFFHKEICRRFCIEGSEDKDVKEFQKKCEEAGIPNQFINIDQWQIEEVTPLGMGNPTLAKAMAKEMIEILPMLDPTAQQEAKHEIVLAITRDPRKAARWVPLNKGRGITAGREYSMAMFGTLMQGVPVPPKEGLPVIDQFDAMEPLLAGKIARIEQRDNKATPSEALGMGEVADFMQKCINLIAQDPKEAQRAKQYGDSLGQLMNQIKGLAQRGAESQSSQNGNGVDPASMAKATTTMMLANVKARVTADKAKQQQKHKDEQFVRQQRRDDAKTFADIERQDELHKSRLGAFDE